MIELLPALLFYAFAAVLVGAALGVVTAPNPVHAALFLVLSFFTSAAIWILLKAEFLALVLMLVYVGAVMVLFLFVVMMLDIRLAVMREKFKRHLLLAMMICGLVILEIAAAILLGLPAALPESPEVANTMGLTAQLGMVLYTHYLYPVEIAAAILMAAMVAAVVLTLRHRRDVTYTSARTAVRVQAEDRVKLIAMPAEKTHSDKREDA